MELITYDAQSCRGQSCTGPEIRFNRSGIVTLNSKVCQELDLHEGDQIKVHQDKKKKQDWYIEKVTMGGLKLKKNHAAGSIALTIQSALICKEVLLSLGKDKPVKLPVATTPLDGKYYALITAALK
jgi:hypothetical protein